jgi:hypothetical protein
MPVITFARSDFISKQFVKTQNILFIHIARNQDWWNSSSSFNIKVDLLSIFRNFLVSIHHVCVAECSCTFHHTHAYVQYLETHEISHKI